MALGGFLRYLPLVMTDNFVVSARKYRPQDWESVVGQQAITSTLKSAIANGQIAQAYLFCGPRGVGKTTCARIFSKVINADPSNPDQELAFSVFELDAASNNSVEDIRSITEQVRIPPQIGKYKVYIIDEVHMLSQAAFNAFLKTLEEPPPHAIFILATTEKHKIIPTILSRCQIFDFNRIKINDIASHLQGIAEKEGIETDPEGLHVIAQKADGAMRDALSIFDQIVAFSGKKVTYDNVIANLNVLDHDYYFKATDFIRNEDISGSLLLFNEVVENGFDGHQFIVGLGEHLRNLLVCKDANTVQLLEVTEGIRERFLEQSAQLDIRTIIDALDFINTCDNQYKTSKNQRLTVELCLMQLCSIPYNQLEKKKPEFRLKPFSASQVKVIKSELPTHVEEELEIAEEPMMEVAEVLPPKPEVTRMPVTPLQSGMKINKAAGISLSGLFQDTGVSLIAEASEEMLESEKRSDAYTAEQFEAAWKAFAAKLLEEDRRSVYNTLIAELPEVEEHIIELKINNSVQQAEIDVIRTELLEFLRNELQNDALQMTTVMVKDDSSKVLHYTDRDKFKAMAEINPALEHFRKRLNLDLDF